MKRPIIILIVLLLVVTLPLAAQKYWPKEKFTEIYFNNPEKLPKEIGYGTEYNLSFTIISHEKESAVYDYRINSEIVSREGQITLTPEKNQTFDLTFKLENKEYSKEGNVTVYLKNSETQRDIYFFYRIVK